MSDVGHESSWCCRAVPPAVLIHTESGRKILLEDKRHATWWRRWSNAWVEVGGPL